MGYAKLNTNLAWALDRRSHPETTKMSERCDDGTAPSLINAT
jgi:hypothetical protein